MELSDFITTDLLGMKTLKYKQIIEISDEEFKEFYFKMMEQYRDENGWWKNDKIPYCMRCHEKINNPSELRRYYGNSLHPNCFIEHYNEDSHKTDNHLLMKYWERVSNLV